MIRILFVDDDSDYLEVTSELLQRVYGHRVTSVEDLGSALAEARSSRFDCLVTDKNLGRSRGVMPLLDFMQSERPGVPVIICSGEPGEHVKRELYCQGFVYKPYAVDELPGLIKRLVVK